MTPSPPDRASPTKPDPTDATDRKRPVFFFSSRMGCLGSLLISVVLTVILLLIFGIL